MSIDHSELEGLSPEELEQKFLADANLFYGPDPEIMADHDISHRSPREEELLARPDDRELFALVRSKIQAGLNESFEMMEQMGAAPGAKWGDLVSALFTGSGDLAAASSGGVLLFSTLVDTMGLVVFGFYDSPQARHGAHPERFPVTLKCF